MTNDMGGGDTIRKYNLTERLCDLWDLAQSHSITIFPKILTIDTSLLAHKGRIWLFCVLQTDSDRVKLQA